MKIIDYFIFLQLTCFYIGIGFSAHGGNSPDLPATSFIYLKGIFLLIPVITVIFIFLIKPLKFYKTLKRLFLLNKFLFYYIGLSFAFLIFSIDIFYSLSRWSIFFYSSLSLFCLILQYIFFYEKTEIWSHFLKHVKYFSFGTIFLFLYSIIKNNPQSLIPGVRNSVQELNLIHPNILASFCTQILFLSYFNKEKTIFNKINLTTFICFIILIFSRSIFVAFFLTVLFINLVVYIKENKKQNLLKFILLIFSIFVLLICYFSNTLSETKFVDFLNRGNDVESLYTLTNRTILWDYILQNLSIKTFIFGNGFSVIDENFGINFGSGILYGAHNAYLSVLLGSGFICLVLILIYLLKILKNFKNIDIAMPSILYTSLSVYMIFILNCFFSEEFGVNLTITFSFLILIYNLSFFSIADKS